MRDDEERDIEPGVPIRFDTLEERAEYYRDPVTPDPRFMKERRMLDLTKIQPAMLGVVRLAHGADSAEDTSKDVEIRVGSSYDFIDSWLRYEGIIGYTGAIMALIDDARKAEVPYAENG